MPNPVIKKPVEVKKVDVKAPRFGKKGFIYHVVNRKLYDQWAKENKDALSWNEFKEVWTYIAEEIIHEVTTNPLGVRLPFYNGDLSTNYVEMLNRHRNQGVKCLDWHSNKRQGKVVWAVRNAAKKHRWISFFAFQPCRELKTAAAAAFMNNPDIFRFTRTNEYIATKLLERKK